LYWADYRFGIWEEFPPPQPADAPPPQPADAVADVPLEYYDRERAHRQMNRLLATNGNELCYVEFMNEIWPNELGPVPYIDPPEYQHTTARKCPFCENRLAYIFTRTDMHGKGRTLKCEKCDECFFYTLHDGCYAVVHLPNLLQARVDGLPRRPATEIAIPRDGISGTPTSREHTRFHHKKKHKHTLDF
jgi:hypothetical protein